MPFVFELLISAAIMGLVIAWLERSEFPGWGQSLGSAFGIGFCAFLLRLVLPEGLWVLAYVGGAIGGAFILAWLCELPLRRAFLAVALYLPLRIGFTLIFGSLT